MDLTVIIPARNEQYLQKTIESVLAASEADTEIIAICDGYWPDPPIQDHPKVNLIHHSESRGQRQGINEAARIAKGKYFMKLDAHCSVGPGFDRILIENYQPGWTVVPRMRNLDVKTWEPKLIDDFEAAMLTHKVHDYMHIGFNEKGELRTLYYAGKSERENRNLHRRPELLDETMSCMGCCFFLSAEQFWAQGGCDENHGSWGQQGVEVALKAWLSGNALMVNKRTWFAHWFRASDGGFPYPIGGRTIEAARNYSKNLWLNNNWPGQVRTLEWLVKKFNPPGWEEFEFEKKVTMPAFDVSKQMEVNAVMYQHIHRESREPTYRGVRIIKMPTDLALYHQVIWENRPKWIIETGTKFGGSSLYFQDQLDMIGEGGKVVTIDINAVVVEKDPRITYITGSSVDRGIVAQVKEMVGDDSVMVVLDSNHNRKHVKWELYHYGPMVTQGQYLVVEDCYTRSSTLYRPGEARDWFLTTRAGRQFEQTNLDRQFLVGVCLGGWLRRK